MLKPEVVICPPRRNEWTLIGCLLVWVVTATVAATLCVVGAANHRTTVPAMTEIEPSGLVRYTMCPPGQILTYRHTQWECEPVEPKTIVHLGSLTVDPLNPLLTTSSTAPAPDTLIGAGVWAP